MKLAIMTKSTFFVEEDKILTSLFDEGMDLSLIHILESFYKHVVEKGKKVIYHGNEWMTGLGVLYVNKHLPEVATVFTTHAVSYTHLDVYKRQHGMEVRTNKR